MDAFFPATAMAKTMNDSSSASVRWKSVMFFGSIVFILLYQAKIFLIVELTEIAEMLQEFTHQVIGDNIFNIDEVLALQFLAFCHTHG
jgi:hypothetical protein